MMTLGLVGMPNPSLAAMVDSIKAKITRESLHLRFTEAAVEFMKKCISFALQQKFKAASRINARLLRHFKRIHIVDSTSWDINPLLEDILPGSGGGASSANCKVQLFYEYLHGVFSFFEIVPGTRPDSRYSANLPERIHRGELLIADLGYFCIKTFSRICQRGAFFLSRFYVGTTLFDQRTRAVINLRALLKRVKDDAYELSVLMGPMNQNQVACRLICLRVSEEVANERRRKLLKTSRKKQRTPSQQHLFMAGWILMVTNVPQEWLPAGMVRPFYSLRWQIELLFKQLKSTIKIHNTNTAKEPRLRCELLGRLLVAILIQNVHAHVNTRMWNTKHQEISFEKLYKRVQERAFIILEALLKSVKAAAEYIEEEVRRLLKNCKKLRQKSRLSTLEFLEYGRNQRVRKWGYANN